MGRTEPVTVQSAGRIECAFNTGLQIIPSEKRHRANLDENNSFGEGVLGNGGSGPSEGYEVGETEDLYFIPETTATICQDFNGDGVVNMDDLTDFVNEWLANCP